MTLEELDFDGVILLGSDDYIDESFLEFARNNIDKYDMIGFKDLYFESGKDLYYWSGYTNSRRGEPSGAGKIYSKKFLEKINYNLFPESRERGLDGISWKRVKGVGANVLVTSIKDKGLFLCDVKDGEGMTRLENIRDLMLVEK